MPLRARATEVLNKSNLFSGRFRSGATRGRRSHLNSTAGELIFSSDGRANLVRRTAPAAFQPPTGSWYPYR